MSRIFMLICIIIVIILGLAVSCAPVDTSTTTTKTNVEGYGMKLMAEQDDIQVWRMVDHLSATCYITINSQRYQPAEIFCLK